MTGRLLLRGMLIGIFAGLLSFTFLKVVGEPSVERAITFESQMDAARDKAAAEDAKVKGQPMPAMDDHEEVFSRSTQAGIGLFTGVSIYSVAFGGIFAILFALTYRRMGPLGPRATSAIVAGLGFISVYVVPNLKYPANPPSVGDPGTIGVRTAVYFGMMLISLVSMAMAFSLRRAILSRLGGWNATIVAGAFYALAVLCAALLLPGIDEVPKAFPAAVLWQFRIASIGAQLVMWTTLGVVFGAVADNYLKASSESRPSLVPQGKA